MIETDNLMIRRFRGEDLPEVHQILSDPAVTAFSGFDPFSSEQSEAWLHHRIVSCSKAGPFGVFALELKASQSVIGYCGLEELPPKISDEIEVTVGLASKHWGKGYGVEAVSALLEYAFRDCRLDRVVAVVHVENQTAHRLVMNCGFQRQRDLIVEGVGRHILFSAEPNNE